VTLNDKVVWYLLITGITFEMNENGYPCTVIQAYQPTQQGVETTPVISLNRINSKRYGFPERTSYYDQINDKVIMREGYWLESTYQVNAYVIQKPEDQVGFTAFDYLDRLASFLQNEEGIKYFRDLEIGILRIEQIRVNYFLDDRGRHEQVPSFDFTITYRQTTEKEIIPIVTVTAEIYEV